VIAFSGISLSHGLLSTLFSTYNLLRQRTSQNFYFTPVELRFSRRSPNVVTYKNGDQTKYKQIGATRTVALVSSN
jgi:hypothetical protein